MELFDAIRANLLSPAVLFFVLVGALVVGALCGEAGMKKVEPFFVAPFQGVLALFLLEMGVVAGRRVGDLRKVGFFLLGFGVLVPLVNGTLGVLIGKFAGLGLGGAIRSARF